MVELWRDIKDYEGLYQVSNWGRVKSLNYRNTGKEGILKGIEDGRGYLCVHLCNDDGVKNKKIHRLVAEAFIPNPENKPEVDHIDRNKLNNNLSNIRWADRKIQNNNRNLSNMIKKFSKPVLQFTLDGEFVREWESTIEIYRELGYSQGNISSCCLGRLKSAYGFKWKYKEV
jgi:hypothetical protein